jgi:hypothetical protein
MSLTGFPMLMGSGRGTVTAVIALMEAVQTSEILLNYYHGGATTQKITILIVTAVETSSHIEYKPHS